MKIQPINIMCKPKPNFTQSERHPNVDRTITIADLYEMEDRINQRLDKQDEAIAKSFWYITDSLTFNHSDDDSSQTINRMKLHANVCDSLVKLNSMNDIDEIRFGE